MKNSKQGFTLIEVLIALSVFAILATITSTALYHAFNTRARVNQQADKLNALQLAISILSRDTEQVVERRIRGNEMRLFPSFVGLPRYYEFTRDGFINPDALEARSTLKRVALICKNNQLIRRTWSVLDPVNHNKAEDKILLDNISHCEFKYINSSLQSLSEWRADALTQNQRQEPMPKAIQINFTVQNWGEFNYLLPLPPSLYVSAVE